MDVYCLMRESLDGNAVQENPRLCMMSGRFGFSSLSFSPRYPEQ